MLSTLFSEKLRTVYPSFILSCELGQARRGQQAQGHLIVVYDVLSVLILMYIYKKQFILLFFLPICVLPQTLKNFDPGEKYFYNTSWSDVSLWESAAKRKVCISAFIFSWMSGIQSIIFPILKVCRIMLCFEWQFLWHATDYFCNATFGLKAGCHIANILLFWK